MYMGKLCGAISGLALLAAGVTFIVFAPKFVGIAAFPDIVAAHQIGGALLALSGLGFTLHGLHWCPMCNSECKDGKCC